MAPPITVRSRAERSAACGKVELETRKIGRSDALGGEWRWNRGMASSRLPLPPDPVIEEYKKHLDESLLRESLRRTPEERILAMISMQELVEELRRARAEHDELQEADRKPG